MARIAIIYATLGRPDVIRPSVDHLQGQSRAPDIVVVSATAPHDVEGLAESPLAPQILFGAKGLCAQRNTALRALGPEIDVALFLDDDFLPAHDYLKEAEAIFDGNPDVVGLTGRIIADGIKTPGYSFDDSIGLLAADQPPQVPSEHPREALYGCNMAVRLSTLAELEFDEKLPFYGWLEDIDLTYRLGRRGRLIDSDRCAGVHMGVKGGRTSGRRFGYSQIANPHYMLRKKSIPPKLAAKLVCRNIASNIARSLRPEPYVDRRGRLAGNLIALRDLMSGRLHPERIRDFV